MLYSRCLHPFHGHLPPGRPQWYPAGLGSSTWSRSQAPAFHQGSGRRHAAGAMVRDRTPRARGQRSPAGGVSELSMVPRPLRKMAWTDVKIQPFQGAVRAETPRESEKMDHARGAHTCGRTGRYAWQSIHVCVRRGIVPRERAWCRQSGRSLRRCLGTVPDSGNLLID